MMMKMQWFDEAKVFEGRAPAKVNLFLAVTGQREDGFHSVLSWVSPIDLCDGLTVRCLGEGQSHRFQVTGPSGAAVEGDADNLVLRAADVFLQKLGVADGFAFGLQKNIPVGAGLGGGSSDAVTTLRLLNEGYGFPFSQEDLCSLAAQLGSDCPLFLYEGPSILRGRGEQVEAVPMREEWCNKRVLLFRPEFAVNTAWAYGQFVKSGQDYLGEVEAEAALQGGELYNTFEAAIARKFLAIPTLLKEIREGLQIPALMSGSGSVCFALVEGEAEREAVTQRVNECWGEDAVLGVFDWY